MKIHATTKLKALFLLIFLGIFTNVTGQEDCSTAQLLPFGATVNGNNSGALPDQDFGPFNGCPSADYFSSIWFELTLPIGVSSINLTLNVGTIGSASSITLVEDCSGPSAANVAWSACDLTSLDGITQTICNLKPNSTYYIQVTSNTTSEGTFDLNVISNPLSPPNDVCSGAYVVFGGVLECGEWETLPDNPLACGDPEATGNCVSPNDHGVWYTFDTPATLPYSLISSNPVGHSFELFSSASGDCSDLVYVSCGEPGYSHELQGGTTYYLLVHSSTQIQAFLSADQTTCNTALDDLNNGAGTGGSNLGLNSCTPGDPVMPCQNDNIVWYNYTVGCNSANISLSLDTWDAVGPEGEIEEGGIMAIDQDCSTLLSNYDTQGNGFICSGIIGNETLFLENLPPGYQFIIAVGSDNPFQGYYELIVTETPTTGNGSNNDFCAEAIEVFEGLNADLDNECATSDFATPLCPDRDDATVWYTYAPSGSEDITINITPQGIADPVLAVHQGCSGTLLDHTCDGSLEISCIEEPINIQVGSAFANIGQFDLTITSAPAFTAPPVTATFGEVCSGEGLNLTLELPFGVNGDIFIDVAPGNSSDIVGLLSQSFTDVNDVFIDYNVENCGSTIENAIFEVTTAVDGASCPSEIQIIEVPILPKLIPEEIDINGCETYEITVDIADVITGGTGPYSDIQWYLDGVPIHTGESLTNYGVSEDGTITVEVVDAKGCTASSQVNVISFDVVDVNLTSDLPSVCQGSGDILTVTAMFEDNRQIFSTIWEVRDDQGNVLNYGFPVGDNLYSFEADFTPPGVYTVICEAFDPNNCSRISQTIDVSVLTGLQGRIEVSDEGECNIGLVIKFYDENGGDIFDNGPDLNDDGIPDLYDSDNDGLIDGSIIWTRPNGSNVQNDLLTLNPEEDGSYSAAIAITSGCDAVIEGITVTTPPKIEPTLTGPFFVCLPDSAIIECSPDDYASIRWTSYNGDLLGQDRASITVFPNAPGQQYYLEVTDQYGCTFVDSIFISSNQTPIIQLTGATTVCPGETTIIDATLLDTTWTYVWLDALDNILSTDTSFLEFTDGGEYSVIATSLLGCADTSSFTLEVKDEVDLEIAGQNICGDQPSVLNGGQGFDSYVWTDLQENELGSNSTLSVSNAGSYILEVQVGQCQGRDTINITKSEPPTLDLPTSLAICNSFSNDPDTLIDLLSISNASGSWSSPTTTDIDLSNLSEVSFGHLEMGNYLLIFETDDAIEPCENAIDTLLVEVSNCDCPYLEILRVDTVCNTIGEYSLSNAVLGNTGQGSWSFIDGPTNIQVNGNQLNVVDFVEGNYKFTYELNESAGPNCTLLDTFILTVKSPPSLAVIDTVVCNIESEVADHTLNLNSLIVAGEGSWVDPEISGLDFSDPTNLDFTNVEPGEYSISITSTNTAFPCDEVMATASVIVLNCNCPIIELMEGFDFCNQNGISIDLGTLSGISADGSWYMSSDNPEEVEIVLNQPIFDNKTNGTYGIVYILDEPVLGCPDRDTIFFGLINTPVISDANDTTSCNVDNGDGRHLVNLNELIVTNSQGEWRDDQGNLVNTPEIISTAGQQAGSIINFEFTTTDALPPCPNVDEKIRIEVIDCNCLVPEFLDPPVLCNSGSENTNLDKLIINDLDGEWTIIESPSGDTDMLEGSVFRSNSILSGQYTVAFRIAEAQGQACEDNWQLDIFVSNQDTAQVESNTIICTSNQDGQKTIVDLFESVIAGSMDGMWTDENKVSISNTIIDFLERTPGTYNYTYTIESEFPCEPRSYELEVSALSCNIIDPNNEIIIPTVFNPGIIGENGRFFPISKNTLEVKSMLIFDRWGNQVFNNFDFKTNSMSDGWDGTLDGKIAAQGVYVYLIRAIVNGEEELIAGDVTLVR